MRTLLAFGNQDSPCKPHYQLDVLEMHFLLQILRCSLLRTKILKELPLVTEKGSHKTWSGTARSCHREPTLYGDRKNISTVCDGRQASSVGRSKSVSKTKASFGKCYVSVGKGNGLRFERMSIEGNQRCTVHHFAWKKKRRWSYLYLIPEPLQSIGSGSTGTLTILTLALYSWFPLTEIPTFSKPWSVCQCVLDFLGVEFWAFFNKCRICGTLKQLCSENFSSGII